MVERLKTATKRLRREVMAVCFAARNPRASLLVRTLAWWLMVAHALGSFDLIPDVLPVFGLLDGLLLVLLGICLVLNVLPAGARAGAVGVIGVWVGSDRLVGAVLMVLCSLVVWWMGQWLLLAWFGRLV